MLLRCPCGVVVVAFMAWQYLVAFTAWPLWRGILLWPLWRGPSRRDFNLYFDERVFQLLLVTWRLYIYNPLLFFYFLYSFFVILLLIGRYFLIGHTTHYFNFVSMHIRRFSWRSCLGKIRVVSLSIQSWNKLESFLNNTCQFFQQEFWTNVLK